MAASAHRWTGDADTGETRRFSALRTSAPVRKVVPGRGSIARPSSAHTAAEKRWTIRSPVSDAASRRRGIARCQIDQTRGCCVEASAASAGGAFPVASGWAGCFLGRETTERILKTIPAWTRPATKAGTRPSPHDRVYWLAVRRVSLATAATIAAIGITDGRREKRTTMRQIANEIGSRIFATRIATKPTLRPPDHAG